MTDRTSALNAWLALEREAVWLYPLIGARVAATADTARASLSAHQRSRDRLLAELGTDNSTRARAAYEVPPLTNVEQAQDTARDLERRIQAACATAIGASAGSQRTLPLTGLRTAALAELTWGASPRAFPGLT